VLGPLRPTWLSTSEAPRNSMDCRGRCDSYMQANERRLIREISKSARRLFSAASQKEADGFRLPQWRRGRRQREAVRCSSYAIPRQGGNTAGLLGVKLDPANRRLH